MKKLYPIIFVLILISNTIYLSAQERFERRYPLVETNVYPASLTTAGAGYASIGVEVNTSDKRTNVNLIFFDKKGTIDGSRSVFYGDDVEVLSAGEIIRLTDGSFAFSAVLDKDSLNKVITRVDNLGNHFWTTITGQITDKKEASQYPSVLMAVPHDNIFHAHSISTDGNSTDIQLTSVDYEGEIDFVRKISYNSPTQTVVNERFIKMQLAIDSTIMVLGSTDDPDAPFFLSKMDTLGNIIWSKSYNGDFGRDLDTEGYDLTQLLDGNWAILGSVLPNNIDRHSGIILTVDDAGNRLKSEHFQASTSRYQIYPNGIVTMLDSTVVMSMIREDMISETFESLIINYNLDSVIAYQSLLDTCIAADPDYATLVTVDSMSASILTATSKNRFIIPNLSKLDQEGSSACEDFVSDIVIDSVDFNDGELTTSVTSMMVDDSIEVALIPFGRYSPPILTLPDTTFCPQDPVVFFVDATVRGGVTYIWDDATVGPTRTFTETGMFSVTVTVQEDICFTLCDTLNIMQLEFPSVSIEKNFGNFCTRGDGILNASVMGASIESFMWSNGSTETAIVVEGTPATYGVTVVDGCGNEATDNTSISEGEFLMPNPLGLEAGRDNICVDGTISITATQQSDPALITWSTGATNTLTITVDEPGSYTADVGGFCPDSETLSLGDNDFIPSVEAQILFDCGNPGQLTVFGTGFLSQTWSTGETTTTIDISQAGTYSVIVTDECGDAQDPIEIQVSAQDIDDCTSCDSPCLIWPNAFQPQGGAIDNRSFGPKVLARCEDGLVSYELQIYNRWGKNIFTSTDVGNTWNGAIDGDPQPGGVYYYWSRFNDGTTTCERRGDLTLLR